MDDSRIKFDGQPCRKRGELPRKDLITVPGNATSGTSTMTMYELIVTWSAKNIASKKIAMQCKKEQFGFEEISSKKAPLMLVLGMSSSNGRKIHWIHGRVGRAVVSLQKGNFPRL